MMGETYRTFYSDGFPSDGIGRVTGSSVVTRFPNIPGQLFKLHAWSTNIGPFYIGMVSGSSSQYWELNPNYDTGWFKLSTNNLNQLFFYNPSGSTQVLGWWVQN